MAAMFSGTLMLQGVPVWAAIALSLLIGAAIGMLNGLVVTMLHVPAMLATLGMQYVVRGLALIITDGGVVNLMTPSAGRANPGIADFLSIGSGKLFGIIPNMAIIFVALFLLAAFFFHKMLLGFQMRAVGGNPAAAVASGISSGKVKIIAFMIMGFFASFAGMLNFSFLNSVQGTMGQGIEMDVIAASIIGGASLSGGEATMPGTVIGVLIMGVLRTGLVFMGVSAYLQMVFIGAVIIFAVAADMWTKRNK